MTQLQITIDLDNDAFRDEDEILRILAVIASRFPEAHNSGKWENAHDINGNPVAKFNVDKEAEPSFS